MSAGHVQGHRARGRMSRWRAEDAVCGPAGGATGEGEQQPEGPRGQRRPRREAWQGGQPPGRGLSERPSPAPAPGRAQRARCWHSKGGGGAPAAPRSASRWQREQRRGDDPRRGGATCRAPPAAPGCPSCRGYAWPGRARAAWRGPAPRSAPPARTWRGC